MFFSGGFIQPRPSLIPVSRSPAGTESGRPLVRDFGAGEGFGAGDDFGAGEEQPAAPSGCLFPQSEVGDGPDSSWGSSQNTRKKFPLLECAATPKSGAPRAPNLGKFGNCLHVPPCDNLEVRPLLVQLRTPKVSGALPVAAVGRKRGPVRFRGAIGGLGAAGERPQGWLRAPLGAPGCAQQSWDSCGGIDAHEWENLEK